MLFFKNDKDRVKAKRGFKLFFLVPLFLAGFIGLYFIHDLKELFFIDYDFPFFNPLGTVGIEIPDRHAESFWLTRSMYTIQIVLQYFLLFFTISMIVFFRLKSQDKDETIEITRGSMKIEGNELRNMVYLYVEDEKNKKEPVKKSFFSFFSKF